MNKSKIILLVASILFGGMNTCDVVSANNANNEIDSYNLDNFIVEGEVQNNYNDKYIRTGGDVNFITSQDIKKYHYSSLTDAIKKIPGVEIQSVGYKAMEYGYSSYQDTITINGDSRVLILIDGKRISNEANSSAAGEHSKAQLFAMIPLQNVESVEVIKGAAAMAYGTDATGGVINIITKKGEYASTSLDVSYGSWKKQNYNISNSGKKDKFSWIAAYSKDKRGDMKYVDREYKTTRTYYNSGYDEDNTFVKINYDFDENQSIDFMHTYKDTFAYYPIMAPDYSSKDALDEAIKNNSFNPSNNGYDKLPQSNPAWNRYHRWWYVFNDGSFTKNRTSNYDLKYTFKDEDGINNYIRLYNNENRYYMDRNRPYFNDYTKLDRKQYSWAKEQAKGFDIRWGKEINKNNYLYTGLDYTDSSFSQEAYAELKMSNGAYTHGKISSITRDTLNIFVQDKIILNKLAITPGIRYNYYGKNKGWELSSKDKLSCYNTDSYSKLTMGLFANYEIDENSSVYASWSQVYNAPYAMDITRAENKLEAEEGNAYTLGYKADFNKSSFGVNYTLTRMDNTFGKFRVPKKDDPEELESKVTNIASKVYSIGLSYKYNFDKNWNLALGYSHASTDIDTKANTSANATYEELRNNLHYNNRYTTSLEYSEKKFNTGLSAVMYTGMDTQYFSDNRFLVLDFHANYKIDKNTTAYVLVNNITNTSYETKAVAAEGIGALPMEGRNFLVGVNYTF